MAESPRARPTVGIAIVNWNAGRQLGACLASIAASHWERADLTGVVVVDNASSDGSADGVLEDEGRRLPLDVIRNRDNRGFAAACNQAALRIDADYLLFLNPDTVLEPAAIGAAAALLGDTAHAATGIVGIQLVDDSGAVSRSCARFPTPGTMVARSLGLDRLLPSLFPGYLMTDWDHGVSQEVDHVIGAFYLVRAGVFRALGGFDVSFFVYFEDLDFSRRARQAGWRSYYLATARAFHKGGGTSAQIKSARLVYSLRSRMRYAGKHFSPAAAAAVAFCTCCLEPAVRLAACALGGSPTGFRETLTAYRRLWFERRNAS